MDELVTTETEDSYQVSCFISQDIKYMYTALRKVSDDLWLASYPGEREEGEGEGWRFRTAKSVLISGHNHGV